MFLNSSTFFPHTLSKKAVGRGVFISEALFWSWLPLPTFEIVICASHRSQQLQKGSKLYLEWWHLVMLDWCWWNGCVVKSWYWTSAHWWVRSLRATQMVYICSYHPCRSPHTQIFFRVSGLSVKLLIITSLTLYLNSLNIPIWILKAMLLNYLSQLSLYQFK